jgi:hypothetical protein
LHCHSPNGRGILGLSGHGAKSSLVTLSMPLIVHSLRNGPFIAAYPRTVTRLNALMELPVDLPVR